MTKKKWVYVAFLAGLALGFGSNQMYDWNCYLWSKVQLNTTGAEELSRRKAAYDLLKTQSGKEYCAKVTDCPRGPGIREASKESTIAIINAWGDRAWSDQYSTFNIICSLNDPDEAIAREAAAVLAADPIHEHIKSLRGAILMSQRLQKPAVTARLQQILAQWDYEIHKPLPVTQPSVKKNTQPVN